MKGIPGPIEVVFPYDDLLDGVAAVCDADDPDAIAALYNRDELRVPAALIG
jgi:hypothetical protein